MIDRSLLKDDNHLTLKMSGNALHMSVNAVLISEGIGGNLGEVEIHG